MLRMNQRLLYKRLHRMCSSTAGGNDGQAQKGEQLMVTLLKNKFPKANVQVQDISGGCGAMYEVFVEAKEFEGLSILKQHRLITDTLKTQIKDIHGVRIHTNTLKD